MEMDKSKTPRTVVAFLSFIIVTFVVSSLSWAAGSVRYSYEKVEVGSDVQWVLVPRADTSLKGSEIGRASCRERV